MHTANTYRHAQHVQVCEEMFSAEMMHGVYFLFSDSGGGSEDDQYLNDHDACRMLCSQLWWWLLLRKWSAPHCWWCVRQCCFLFVLHVHHCPTQDSSQGYQLTVHRNVSSNSNATQPFVSDDCCTSHVHIVFAEGLFMLCAGYVLIGMNNGVNVRWLVFD